MKRYILREGPPIASEGVAVGATEGLPLDKSMASNDEAVPPEPFSFDGNSDELYSELPEVGSHDLEPREPPMPAERPKRTVMRPKRFADFVCDFITHF